MILLLSKSSPGLSRCIRDAATRSVSTWIPGFLRSSPDERKLFIEQSLFPQLTRPVEQQTIVLDLTKSVGGVSVAVQLRNDIQKFTEGNSRSASQLDEMLQNWLSIVFCVDSLTTQQITFDSAGSVLERIARSDNVHAVRSISGLKKRLQSSRRCFALFHNALPNFPLAFIHIGLTNNLAYSMSSLDTLMNSDAPTHAMFYSVNSTSPAFRGLSLAPHLIKEAVRNLQLHCPSIKTFSTLSPIPNFLRWLSKAKGTAGYLTETHIANVRKALQLVGPSLPEGRALETLSNEEVLQCAGSTLMTKATEFAENAEAVALLEQPLMRLAARYITTTRTSKDGSRGSIEPVANFHMGNGAQFHRLNWMGDPSLQGLRSSAGIMVNYLYDLPNLETNAAQFRAVEGSSTGAADRTSAAKDSFEGLAVGSEVLKYL